jgi:hypothetical protein
MERNTHPVHASGEFHNRDGTPSPTASNQPATSSLVLGLSAFVIQLLAFGDWLFLERQHDAAFERFLAGEGPNPNAPNLAGFLILSVVSFAVGISAIAFGRKGRRFAEVVGTGRTRATMGLVLGIVSVAIPISAALAFIRWLDCCLDTL